MELTIEQAEEYADKMNAAMQAAVLARIADGPLVAANTLAEKQREVAAWLYGNGYCTTEEFNDIQMMIAYGYRDYLRSNGLEPDGA